jgi:hypothetical protein
MNRVSLVEDIEEANAAAQLLPERLQSGRVSTAAADALIKAC